MNEKLENKPLLVVVHPFFQIPTVLTRPLVGENLLPDYSCSYASRQTYLENMVNLIRNHQGNLLFLETSDNKYPLEKNLRKWRKDLDFKVIGTQKYKPTPLNGWEEFDEEISRLNPNKILAAGGLYFKIHDKGKDIEIGCLGTVVKRMREQGYKPEIVKEAIFS